MAENRASMSVEERRRRRRRLRRQAAVLVFLMLAFGLAWFFESQATTTVIFTRHADIDPAGGADQGLSPAGEARAAELARVLGDADVVTGVDAIFATQYRYSQETAGPLAHALHLQVEVVDVNDVDGLIGHILKEWKGKVVLVITDSDPLPLLIQKLHGSKKLPPLGAGEYDNLYVVSIPWYGKVKTLRLKYGAHYLPSADPGAAPPPVPAAE
ncbi:MAG: histidine phosphatase family protein [Gammaproteobacteria bacterium]|nr:histidine phosphatase family protein [Gammaproteobacteria bacterium]